MQNENTAACKSATWNSAIHKKSATRKKVQHEKITLQKSVTWHWCSLQNVQDEKSTTWKNINCHGKHSKVCKKWRDC